jgi:hypothetical protein
MRFLPLSEVKARTGLGATSIKKAVDLGELAPPVNISPDPNSRRATNAWPDHEIEAFQKRRLAQRDALIKSSARPRPRDPVSGKYLSDNQPASSE